MTNLQNDRFLKALRREPVDKTPVWLMRQAGRYLPEYRKLREKSGSFLKMCKTPELACEVTLQPLARFPLDAAIIFSDILTIPDAMGLELGFVTGEGPKFNKTVSDVESLRALAMPDPEIELRYVMNAIRTTKQALTQRVPLIGFAGSPWTVATYMVEGGSSKTFSKINKMRYQSPALLMQLLEKITTVTTQYLQAQIAAGADAVMIFDTWGGVLTTEAYAQFSLAFMQRIVDDVKHFSENTPIILFTKGGGQWLEKMATTGCHALGLDWTLDINQARSRVGSKVALQGNLEPACLHGDENVIRQQVASILAKYGSGSGHIFNLGHGITPDILPEKVAALVDAVHEMSQQYHQVTVS